MCVLCVNVFPPCLQVPTGLRRAEIFELGFRNPRRNPCFFKNGNQGLIQRVCGGPTPGIWAQIRDFHWGGCALCWFQGSLVFWAHFQVFVHLWSLKKVAEGNFGFKTVKICKHGWMLSNLSVVFFAFSCMGGHVFRDSIHFREFSDRRFCLPPMFAHAFWCFFEGRLRRMKKM